jgi:hypothetical protein
MIGRRDKDMRVKFDDVGSNVQKGDGTVDKSQGAARAISSFIGRSMTPRYVPLGQTRRLKRIVDLVQTRDSLGPISPGSRVSRACLLFSRVCRHGR